MAGLLKGMPLPSEVLDLFEKFEFEVCLLLRLLSQQPDRRPSAQDMRDELSRSLPSDSNDGDKGQDKKAELEKLRLEVAELRLKASQKEQQEKMHGHSKIQVLDWLFVVCTGCACVCATFRWRAACAHIHCKLNIKQSKGHGCNPVPWVSCWVGPL